MIRSSLRLAPSRCLNISSRGLSYTRTVFQESSKLPEVEEAEDKPLAHVERVSGAPAELSTNRVVRIFKQSKPATQSGNWGSNIWRVDWDTVDRADRWENDLMGWASTGDYMHSLQMKFITKDDAIRFATNQGWDYYVQEPHKRDFIPKNYSDNFYHSKGKLKHIRTK